MYFFSEISQQCIKCAKCIPDCPMYRIHRDELHSPRGLLELLSLMRKEQDLYSSYSKEVKEALDSCVYCSKCSVICPKEIHPDFAFKLAKHTLFSPSKSGISQNSWSFFSWTARFFHGLENFLKGLSLHSILKKIYFFLLLHPKYMEMVFSYLHILFRTCGGRVVFAGLKFRKKSFLAQKYALAQKTQSTQKTQPRRAHALPSFFLPYRKDRPDNFEPKGRVGIFVGCLGNYHMQDVCDCLVEILQELGYDVFLGSQECCGASALFSGELRVAHTLMLRNLEYFSTYPDNLDAILIPEATCAHVILKDYKNLLTELERKNTNLAYEAHLQKLHTTLDLISKKTFLATQWLAKQPEIYPLLQKMNLTVTYHDPCHARFSLGVHKEPRMLLQRAFEFKELSGASECCGFGGLDSYLKKSYENQALGKKKAREIIKRDVQFVSAECSACALNISRALKKENSPIQFKHPLVLLAQALEKSKLL